jgi:pimeloyl-ACP methyl ester carboxylesterase
MAWMGAAKRAKTCHHDPARQRARPGGSVAAGSGLSDAERSARRVRFEARLAADVRRRPHAHDLRALTRLVIDATQGVMDVVGDVQQATSPPIVSHVQAIANAATRSVTGAVGAAIDATLAGLGPMLGDSVPGDEREVVLAALNGVVGDRLAASGSPLAIKMALWPALEDEDRRGTLLLLVHGSSAHPLLWRMPRKDGDVIVHHDHGRALLDSLEREVCLSYALYNSGLHICDNGEQLAALLEREHRGFDEIVLLCHSMGGLVTRSALAVAEREGHRWRGLVSTLITLGTPHHGSHLERAGRVLEQVLAGTRWTAPFLPLGKIRSAGITDLRHGAVIDAPEDRFASSTPLPAHVPLPHDVRTLAIAGTRTPAMPDGDGGAPTFDGLADDNLVPVRSALGLHDDPARTLAFDARHVVAATGHQALLSSAAVFKLIAEMVNPG